MARSYSPLVEWSNSAVVEGLGVIQIELKRFIVFLYGPFERAILKINVANFVVKLCV
jgi:hypothetical protein